ncbi:unnamed protein product, partial [Ectocarpus sp. 12 AP-2014]
LGTPPLTPVSAVPSRASAISAASNNLSFFGRSYGLDDHDVDLPEKVDEVSLSLVPNRASSVDVGFGNFHPVVDWAEPVEVRAVVIQDVIERQASTEVEEGCALVRAACVALGGSGTGGGAYSPMRPDGSAIIINNHNNSARGTLVLLQLQT